MEVADERVRPLESRLDCFERQLGGSEPLLDGVEFAGNAILLGLEEIERDCACVVGLKKLGALVQKTALPADEPLSIFDVVLTESSDLFEQHLLGLKAEVAGQLNLSVVALDGVFHAFDVQGSLRTAAGVALPADADKVGVDSSCVALGVADDQPAAAATAPD